jgi:cytidylate kinase
MSYTSLLVTGLPAAGKSELCKKLTKQLGWSFRSVGDKLRERWAILPEDGRATFEKWWPTVPLEEYVRINEEIHALAEKGSFIGDSRYALNCTDLPALIVFTTAVLDIRAKRASLSPRYAGMTLEQIRTSLQDRGTDEIEMGFKLFQTDYRSPEHYHLVLNTGKLSLDQEVEAIKAALSNGM